MSAPAPFEPPATDLPAPRPARRITPPRRTVPIRPDHERTCDDTTFYSAVLDRVGFHDGAETSADGADNDLAHERAAAVLAFIDHVAPAAWPQALLPAQDTAPTTAGHDSDPGRDRHSIEDLAVALLDLGRLALAFGEITRTAVYHTDRVTPEDDAEHTVMLGWIACALAQRYYPDLNLGLVAQYALVHDAVEVYAGDTPTLRITTRQRAAKADREHAAIDRIRSEFADQLPWFPALITDYEAQRGSEARFVRAVDKVLPKIVHQLDCGHGLAEQGIQSAELLDICARQRADITTYAGEFDVVLRVHATLANQAATLPAVTGDGQVGAA